MIILLKSKLETLGYFIDCMRADNDELIVIDFVGETWKERLFSYLEKINENTIVITFNTAGLILEFSNGVNFWKDRNVKIYNILVDHPMNFRELLEENAINTNIIVVDRYHKLYLERYVKGINSVFFLPHGGITSEHLMSYTQREYDIVYVGSNQKVITKFPALDYLPNRGQELYQFAYDTINDNYNLELIDVLKLYLLENQINLENEYINETLVSLYNTVELICRYEYKMNVMRALAMSGITIHICGGGWHELLEEFPDKIIWHGVLTSKECIEFISNSKLTLNIMPWFKNGSHERIYNAMLNKSVCITDRSVYLEEKFQHGKNIVFFDIENLAQLVSNIKYLLENTQTAQKIIENAYIVASKSTWKDRLNMIVEGDFENETII